jgi:hypothetical protein
MPQFWQVSNWNVLQICVKDWGITKGATWRWALLNHQTLNTEIFETRRNIGNDLAVMIWADGKVDDDEYIALKIHCKKKFEFWWKHSYRQTIWLELSAKNGVRKAVDYYIILKNMSYQKIYSKLGQ